MEASHQLASEPGSTTLKPRRPWLAGLLSLWGFPVGQIYAGRLKRSLVLWTIGYVILHNLIYINTFLSLGLAGFVGIWLFRLAFPIFLAIDAFLIARRDHNGPLKFYQRWWFYPLAFAGFMAATHVVASVIVFFFIDAFKIPSQSMSPTIMSGDRILVSKLYRKETDLRRNDIVVFRSEGPESPLYVMRLIGLPGDQIEMVDEKLLLNGEEWADPHAVLDPELPIYPESSHYGPITIPEGTFFVLGDNRRAAYDSRVTGPIPIDNLYGKAHVIYWSQDRTFPDPQDTSIDVMGPIRWSRIGNRLD